MRAGAVGVDGFRGLAHQPAELPRMRRQDPRLAELALNPLRLRQGVEAVGVDDERALRVLGEVDDQAPRRAVAPQARTDDAHLRTRKLRQYRAVRRVAHRAWSDLRHRSCLDLGALRGKDGI